MAKALKIKPNNIWSARQNLSFTFDKIGVQPKGGTLRPKDNKRKVKAAIAALKEEGIEINISNISNKTGLTRFSILRLGRDLLEKWGVIFYDGKVKSERLIGQRIKEISEQVTKNPDLSSADLSENYRMHLGQNVLTSLGVLTPEARALQRQKNVRRVILAALKDDSERPSYEFLSKELKRLNLEDTSAFALNGWSNRYKDSL